jgi:hypothetical protein
MARASIDIYGNRSKATIKSINAADEPKHLLSLCSYPEGPEFKSALILRQFNDQKSKHLYSTTKGRTSEQEILLHPASPNVVHTASTINSIT